MGAVFEELEALLLLFFLSLVPFMCLSLAGLSRLRLSCSPLL